MAIIIVGARNALFFIISFCWGLRFGFFTNEAFKNSSPSFSRESLSTIRKRHGLIMPWSAARRADLQMSVRDLGDGPGSVNRGDELRV